MFLFVGEGCLFFFVCFFFVLFLIDFICLVGWFGCFLFLFFFLFFVF